MESPSVGGDEMRMRVGAMGCRGAMIRPEPRTLPDHTAFAQAAGGRCRKPGQSRPDPRARREMAPCDRIPVVPFGAAPGWADPTCPAASPTCVRLARGLHVLGRRGARG